MPRFESVIPQQPPFALAIPRFRFRALASFAGRASIGGDREVAIGCLAMGRLAATMLPPFHLSPVDVKARSAAAKQWLASHALPPAIRTPLSHIADSVATGSLTATAWAIEKLLTAVAEKIDEASATELRALIADLAPPAPAEQPPTAPAPTTVAR